MGWLGWGIQRPGQLGLSLVRCAGTVACRACRDDMMTYANSNITFGKLTQLWNMVCCRCCRWFTYWRFFFPRSMVVTTTESGYLLLSVEFEDPISSRNTNLSIVDQSVRKLHGTQNVSGVLAFQSAARLSWGSWLDQTLRLGGWQGCKKWLWVSGV